MRPEHIYMVFAFDGSCVSSSVSAASHADALIALAERCSRAFDLADLMKVGRSYVVFDTQADSNFNKVRVLRLCKLTVPSFFTEAV